MARPPREFEIDGIYHILNRGVEKRKIFLKNQNYHRFVLGMELFNSHDFVDIWEFVKGEPADLLTLKEKLEKYRTSKKDRLVELLAFVLMPNHYHLLIREIKEGGISFFMQKLNGGYSRYFNLQYKRVGSLFQGRYKAVPIETDGQLTTVFVYVHTNPLELKEPEWKGLLKVKNKAQAILWLESYRWSSYLDYIGKPNFSAVTQQEFFLDFFGGKNRCREVVEDWIKFNADSQKLGPEIID